MRLQKARDVWDRASRMLKDLWAYVHSTDEFAFADRLPYVLDLLAGVRRQIDGYTPRPPGFASWWDQQRTPHHEAITSMRNAELKRYEQQSQPTAFTQTYCSAGTFETWSTDGKLLQRQPVNSGDSVTVVTGWQFVGDHFDGEDVMSVLSAELVDLATLIGMAEARIGLT